MKARVYKKNASFEPEGQLDFGLAVFLFSQWFLRGNGKLYLGKNCRFIDLRQHKGHLGQP